LVCALIAAAARYAALNKLVLLAGVAILIAGGLLLADFVFSGDPYVGGDVSRWSRRPSHRLVYAAWLGTALTVAGLLWLFRRRSATRWQVASALSAASAVVLLQFIGAISQDLN
jgi:hypothetical protein